MTHSVNPPERGNITAFTDGVSVWLLMAAVRSDENQISFIGTKFQEPLLKPSQKLVL